MLWEDWFFGFKREKGCKRENVDSSVWSVHIIWDAKKMVHCSDTRDMDKVISKSKEYDIASRVWAFLAMWIILFYYYFIIISANINTRNKITDNTLLYTCIGVIIKEIWLSKTV